jgi:xanthine/CO dehydrogenase XdhC/CoxF family maturation factor
LRALAEAQRQKSSERGAGWEELQSTPSLSSNCLDCTESYGRSEFVLAEDCVVIITRGHAHDETVLRECLSKARFPGYIGMIGSRDKIGRTFANLRDQGISQELIAKVRAPIGLDMGARTPAEIALSIIAEIVAYRYGRSVKPEQP